MGEIRDETDAIARFGHFYVSASCKTGSPCINKKALSEDIQAHARVSDEVLGAFVKSIVALPVYREEVVTGEFPMAEISKGGKISGAKTGAIGVNRLARPETLKEWLLEER